MRELELLGLHSDEQHLVFTDEEGVRYTVTIDDQLRQLVRTERRALASLTNKQSELTPRDMQRLMRAGMTPAEIAVSYQVDQATVAQFEHVILGERAYIANLAKATTIGSDRQSPTAGELVPNRLATRGVDPTSITWDATRTGHQPWIVKVSFVQAANQLEATWEFDQRHHTLTALDDEARWLTETSVTSGVLPPAPNRAHQAAAPQPIDGQTLSLLDRLAARRGQRQSVLTETSEDTTANLIPVDEEPTPLPKPEVMSSEPSAPAQEDAVATTELPLTSPLDSEDSATQSAAKVVEELPHSEAEDDEPKTGILPGMEGLSASAPETEPTPPKRTKRGRPSVPQWDDIIFGRGK
ncbi:hypothetical protein BK816_04720 [Boudabousia tangfeifanii]|uniref:DUF3071 domain-containing protein n=1 Tax=Boudabousia tangfeifanii TaxID=1912795 RepID=A0A1D9MKD2_9ACTO|nr:septation protein SepH [Boudabousia tangfeifanii]AOZ72678.1 hypothetical protein BK816_04720 [Boudabousia tangfeifanii]